mgnify:CR=1 FL=1
MKRLETKTGLIQILISGAILILFYLLMDHLPVLFSGASKALDLIRPLLIGCCIAYLLNIPMTWIESHLGKRLGVRLKRTLALIAVLVLLLGFVVLVSVMVIPQLIKAISTLQSSLPSVLDASITWINHVLVDLKIDYTLGHVESWNINALMTTVLAFLFGSGFNPVDLTVNIFQAILGFMTQFFLSLIFSIYILLMKEKLGKSFKRLAQALFGEHRFYHQAAALVHLIDATFKRYVIGTLTECFILGMIFFVGMTLFRFPYASMIAVLVGTFAVVPIVGGITAMLMGVVLVASIHPELGFWFYIFNQVVQQVENDLIYPKVVGSSVGLPALLVLLAVLIFGDLFGAVGMIVAVPVVSVGYQLLTRFVSSQLERKHLPSIE